MLWIKDSSSFNESSTQTQLKNSLCCLPDIKSWAGYVNMWTVLRITCILWAESMQICPDSVAHRNQSILLYESSIYIFEITSSEACWMLSHFKMIFLMYISPGREGLDIVLFSRVCIHTSFLTLINQTMLWLLRHASQMQDFVQNVSCCINYACLWHVYPVIYLFLKSSINWSCK